MNSSCSSSASLRVLRASAVLLESLLTDSSDTSRASTPRARPMSSSSAPPEALRIHRLSPSASAQGSSSPVTRAESSPARTCRKAWPVARDSRRRRAPSTSGSTLARTRSGANITLKSATGPKGSSAAVGQSPEKR